MRFLATCFLVIATAGLLGAAPPTLTVPTEDAHATPGRLLKLKIETTGKYLVWDLVDAPENVDLDVSEDGKSAGFVGPTEGRYRIVVVASSETGELSKAVFYVVVGDAAAPVKPDPMLVKMLTEAGTKDGAVAADYSKLAKVYDTGATKVTDKDNVKTWGDLFNAMAKEAKDQEIAGKIPTVQTAIQNELQKRLVDANGKPVAMSDTIGTLNRLKAKTELKRISNALNAAAK